MRRVKHWESVLARYIESRRTMAFEWGGNDCALFTCDGIQQYTGIDLAAWFRGKYTTQEQAYALVSEYTGGGNLKDLGDKLLGPMRQNGNSEFLFTGRGDAVLMENEGNPAFGICLGAKTAVVFPVGFLLLPTKQAIGSWKI